jgi:hypothetical protein
VVSAINNRPEVRPNLTTDQNHTLHKPADLAGNSVIEKIAPGEYATYAHMQTGSLRKASGPPRPLGVPPSPAPLVGSPGAGAGTKGMTSASTACSAERRVMIVRTTVAL